MKELVRKMRGVAGVGLTWGVLWTVIGYTVAKVIGLFAPTSIDPGESQLVIGGIIGLVGLVSGSAFATLLSFGERRKAIRDLSLSRAAMWGILGSAALPLLTGMQNSLVLITCPLGAAFAVATVAIARKAERRDPGESNLLTDSQPDLTVTRERESRFANLG